MVAESRPSNTSTERALIRTVAGSSRKLDEDLKLSPLQAIDRLQKLNEKFREHWIGAPWLVLEDHHNIPADMPVPEMLNEISQHGEPIGIVGLARLSANRQTVLKMMFRSDEKSRRAVEQSATAAIDRFYEYLRRIRNLHERTNK